MPQGEHKSSWSQHGQPSTVLPTCPPHCVPASPRVSVPLPSGRLRRPSLPPSLIPSEHIHSVLTVYLPPGATGHPKISKATSLPSRGSRSTGKITVGLCVYSLMQYVFIEHLLCSRSSLGHWGYNVALENTVPTLRVYTQQAPVHVVIRIPFSRLSDCTYCSSCPELPSFSSLLI